MNVIGNSLNWDPKAWLPILMVLGSIFVVVFLYFKVKALIRRDAAAHKHQQ
jgi:predicted permease